MTRPKLARLRRLDLAELTWRAREFADITWTRLAAGVRPPTWRRGDLASALTSDMSEVRRVLGAERWQDAHRLLAAHLTTNSSRFVIAPHVRARIAAEINRRFPAAREDACERADRVLAGSYDLLGYRDVRFDGSSWHQDPVHHASAPLVFWSAVPYLDPACGDHKVIWEFNRHQHWLELGRAYWLTDDARYRTEFLRQLQTWLQGNPPLLGINWASMLELGFRSLSWIWALNFFADAATDDVEPWIVDLLVGLDRQLDHIERHLSYYFSPNTHLLGEALALYVAGRALPFLRGSARREAVGRTILLQELTRQVAADGGHCERSAHYHRYTLDFYLLALAIAQITTDAHAGVFERAAARLARTARDLADDEGQLPLLGDDDGGSLLPITRRPPADVRDSLAVAAALTGRMDLLVDDPHEEVWWLLAHDRFNDARTRVDRAPRRVSPTSVALSSTGYYISRNEVGDHLIVDGGPHGYLNGGHAHADALSLSFTHRRRPFLIDPGTATYTVDPALRDQFRSTMAHNTVTVNGRSQSVPRGPFHWQSTADATTRRWRMHRHFDYFVGSHHGYAPLVHARHVLMLHEDMLVVADCVLPGLAGAASTVGTIAAHWHLHPDWTVEISGSTARCHAATDAVDLHVSGGVLECFTADAATGLGFYAPQYGRVEPATTLRISHSAQPPHWMVSVFEFDGGNRVQGIDVEALDTSGEVPFHGAAITITRQLTLDRLIVAEPADDARHLRWRAAEIDADARMLFARETKGELTTLLVVDGATIRSDRYPSAQRSYPSRTEIMYVDLNSDIERRKAS